MGMKRKEIGDAPMPDPIRLVAFFPDGSRKVRVFPDDQDGIKGAVRWEWDRLHEGAKIVEYYRADKKKGTLYSSNWVKFKLGDDRK
jgi:hypothetical protein